MKIVINACHGRFGLSHEAVMEYAELKGLRFYPYIDDVSKGIYGNKATLDNPSLLIHYTLVPQEEYEKLEAEDRKNPIGPSRFEKSSSLYFSPNNIARNDPDLIKVVETLGRKANGFYAKLRIVEIPDEIEWEIEEYDGLEWIAEKHRTWR